MIPTKLFSLIILTFGIVIYNSSISYSFNAEEISALKASIKEMNNNIDNESNGDLQLINVDFINNNEIVYKGKAKYYSKNKVASMMPMMKKGNSKALCSNDDTYILLKYGLKYTYVYYDKDGIYVSRYTVTKKDCR